MPGIVTDVEHPRCPSTRRSVRRSGAFRRVLAPVLAVVTLSSCAVFVVASGAGGDQLGDLQARASQLEQQIAATGEQISALGQQYDAAEYRAQQLDVQINATQAKIVRARDQVASDQTALRTAAVSSYMDAGSSTSDNPLFATNERTLGARQEYSEVATGNLDVAVDDLHIAQTQLSSEESVLQGQEQQASADATEARQAQSEAQQAQDQQSAALSQDKGQIATLVAQQQQEAAAAAAAAAAQQIAAASAAASSSSSSGSGSAADANLPPLPAAPGAATAVAAAESQIGVPYVWGGESPRGTPGDPSGGFDCSGLTAWSWGQAGVPLPHYSGAQMADSTPVSISDLEPGDLLFYGPGGDEHVAMYIGGGEMIEAPYTGASVWVTGLRLGGGFAGAGRP